MNYQKELETIIQQEKKPGKRLFLHSCCAPCSSYVLEYLSAFFSITVFYYNPNISVEEEYRHRMEEQKRFIEEFNQKNQDHFPISFLEGNHEPETYFSRVRGYEQAPEGGERCRNCFELRLEETARQASQQGYDYFCTTLTISPLKNADVINTIGESLAKKWNISFLPADFKKKNGYKRSIEMSREYNLYRQDFCGCVFSKSERETGRRIAARSER